MDMAAQDKEILAGHAPQADLLREAATWYSRPDLVFNVSAAVEPERAASAREEGIR